MSGFRVSPSRTFAVDLRRLPARINLSPSRFMGVIFVVVGLGMAGVNLLFRGMANELASIAGQPGRPDYFLLLFPVAGLAFATLGLFFLIRKRILVFDTDGVTSETRGPGGGTWTLPYTAFCGLRMREDSFQRGSDRSRSRVFYQYVELVHDDPKHTVPLLIRAGREPPVRELHGYAAVLHLPIISR